MPSASGHTHAWSVQTRLEASAEAITLVVAGRLGTEGAADLRAALAAAISGGGCVQVELSAVDYISSAGLEALRGAAAALRATGGSLVVSAASEPVRLALRLGGNIPTAHEAANVGPRTSDGDGFERDPDKT